MVERHCLVCQKPLSGRAHARTCGPTCRQRLRRLRLVSTQPWQAAAHRLERDAPERWALREPRVVYRDVDADFDVLDQW